MVRVGGATEIEVKERKDRVDDAMHASGKFLIKRTHRFRGNSNAHGTAVA